MRVRITLRLNDGCDKQYQSKTEADNEWRSLSNEEVITFEATCKKADETIKFMLANNPFYK